MSDWFQSAMEALTDAVQFVKALEVDLWDLQAMGVARASEPSPASSRLEKAARSSLFFQLGLTSFFGFELSLLMRPRLVCCSRPVSARYQWPRISSEPLVPRMRICFGES